MMSSTSDWNDIPTVGLRKNDFLRIKVKQLAFIGKPAIAIFLTEVTTKIKEKLRVKFQDEKDQQEQRSSHFKSTVSHEMKTPLESVLYFINQFEM